jgi:hypothetical protein
MNVLSALLFFLSDYSAIRTLCVDFPLMGQMVQVQRILESKSIQVFGYSRSLSLHFMELYFENARHSGGGSVEKLVEQDGGCIVTFTESKSKPEIFLNSFLYAEISLFSCCECSDKTS